MRLYDLIELWERDELMRDLSDRWQFYSDDNLFSIQYNDGLGGIQIEFSENPSTFEQSGEEFVVYRLFNSATKEYYRGHISKKEDDIELANLHIGVDLLLKEIYGY